MTVSLNDTLLAKKCTLLLEETNVYYTAKECDKDIFCVGDEKVFASTSVVMAFNTALAFISKPRR